MLRSFWNYNMLHKRKLQLLSFMLEAVAKIGVPVCQVSPSHSHSYVQMSHHCHHLHTFKALNFISALLGLALYAHFTSVFSFKPHEILSSRHYPHYKDKGTEVQRDQATLLRWVVDLGIKPRSV